ncbi:peptidoglycan-binding protein [Streptomyces sp. NPDC007369]|uniref:peptidoglycan-binding domain-containing protein n=1 Tax=Streptomyces sp. NPDC007369 TaxID=3154589 RepID=UPI0033EA2F7C
MGITTRFALRAGTIAVGAAVLAATVATSASASPNARYIRYGDTGYAVKCVQWAINDWLDADLSDSWHAHLILDVDGVFGERTLAMVKQYQGVALLDDDGIVGPETGNYMWTGRLYKKHPECYSYIPTKV